MKRNNRLKIGMYVQTDALRNKTEFDKMISLVEKSKLDILVFPEDSYTPYMENRYNDFDITNDDDYDELSNYCLKLSKDIGAAVIVGASDVNGFVFNVYANAYAKKNETQNVIYYKHTMTEMSSFDSPGYIDDLGASFPYIELKGFTLGMTICYDCNHAMFSRVYSMVGVDVIINSSGGDVIEEKWYRYNKARSIENNCYSLITMGGNGYGYCGSMGFCPNGGEIEGQYLGGKSSHSGNDIKDGIYVYEVTDKEDDWYGSYDKTLAQKDSLNKYKDILLPVKTYEFLTSNKDIKKLKEDLFVCEYTYAREGKTINSNVVFCIAHGEDIVAPEVILSLMYDKCLDKYKNKRYVIVLEYDELEDESFKAFISVLAKVRAMENYCAVIFESDANNICCQTSINRASQLVKAENGKYGIDLNRTTGPEAIWKNKTGMRADWRYGYEALIDFVLED